MALFVTLITGTAIIATSSDKPFGGHQNAHKKERAAGWNPQVYDGYDYDHLHAAAAAPPPDCRLGNRNSTTATNASMSVPIFSQGGTAASVKFEMPDDGGAPAYYMDHVVLPAAAPYDPCGARRDGDDTVDMRIWKRTSHASAAAPPRSSDIKAASSSAGEEIDLELQL